MTWQRAGWRGMSTVRRMKPNTNVPAVWCSHTGGMWPPASSISSPFSRWMARDLPSCRWVLLYLFLHCDVSVFTCETTCFMLVDILATGLRIGITSSLGKNRGHQCGGQVRPWLNYVNPPTTVHIAPLIMLWAEILDPLITAICWTKVKDQVTVSHKFSLWWKLEQYPANISTSDTTLHLDYVWPLTFNIHHQCDADKEWWRNRNKRGREGGGEFPGWTGSISNAQKDTYCTFSRVKWSNQPCITRMFKNVHKSVHKTSIWLKV